MKNFRIYDNKEKTYVNSMNYISFAQAQEEIDYMLDCGIYPDEPCTVFSIHEFNENTFVKVAEVEPALV